MLEDGTARIVEGFHRALTSEEEPWGIGHPSQSQAARWASSASTTPDRSARAAGTWRCFEGRNCQRMSSPARDLAQKPSRACDSSGGNRSNAPCCAAATARQAKRNIFSSRWSHRVSPRKPCHQGTLNPCPSCICPTCWPHHLTQSLEVCKITACHPIHLQDAVLSSGSPEISETPTPLLIGSSGCSRFHCLSSRAKPFAALGLGDAPCDGHNG